MNVLTWRMDEAEKRSRFDLGPWTNEADELFWTSLKTGYANYIRRNPDLGTLNGYVGVGPEHPYLHDADLEITVGGYSITWVGRVIEQENLAMPIPADTTWIGVATGSVGDLMPAAVAGLRRTHGDEYESALERHQTYRTIPFVRELVEELEQQLYEMERRCSKS